MPRQKCKAILDLSDRDMKRRFVAWVGTLVGAWEVDIKPRRNTRSLAQNAFYWSCVCTPFADFLSAQDYELNTPEEAHEILKAKFLTRPVVRPDTGELIGRIVRSTTDLSTEEMTDYIERCRAWLLDFFGVMTNDPLPEGDRMARKRVVSRPRCRPALPPPDVPEGVAV
jgi:hypothetical protein